MNPMSQDRMNEIMRQMRAAEPVSESIQRFEKARAFVQRELQKARAVHQKFSPEVEEFCPEFHHFIQNLEPFQKHPAESYIDAEDRALEQYRSLLEVMHTFFTRLPCVLSHDELEQCPTLQDYLKSCEMEAAG
ncbi:hypothetical protein [Desulfurispira natronophila]|uniref:Soluble cytochrome b562 n=1 Tax=Desulfurispira natronophila TaxID=682562 RepID=A0A7W8DFW4_9BACT|nr:hypothetical protein [Desulfurispira natronophila]MBB5020807.1 soluble cytochrome b562 [Desulfurispira natronophila]